MLYLKKMNLELFKKKRAQATDSWWDRLFMVHGDIRFDDYDKDLTDLPTPVAEVRNLVTLVVAGRVQVSRRLTLFMYHPIPAGDYGNRSRVRC